MKQRTTTGHLKHGSLHLFQTEAAKRKMGDGQRSMWNLKKLAAPVLDWKRK